MKAKALAHALLEPEELAPASSLLEESSLLVSSLASSLLSSLEADSVEDESVDVSVCV